MTFTVRPLEYPDLAETQRLGREAFGGGRPAGPPPTEEEWARSAGRAWGAFDGPTLVAQATVLSLTSWFHGARVPTAGVASVSVQPESRGQGALRPVLDAALAEARTRGEVVSTLFPTAPGIYRRWGYEVVANLDDVELPLGSLARLTVPDGVAVRRATPADLPAVAAVHAAWGATRNGPLARTEDPFATDEKWLDEYSGVTVAVEDGEITGFATWDRGEGYDPRTAVLRVDDLVARTPGAARALWSSLGSHASVVGRLRVVTSGLDAAWLVLPDLTTTLARSRPYMLSLLDVPGALCAGRLAPVTARLPFEVAGTGSFVLEVADGVPAASAAGAPGGAVFAPGGLAALYAGARTPAELRAAGLLTGPDADDAVWATLFSTRRPDVRDYF